MRPSRLPRFSFPPPFSLRLALTVPGTAWAGGGHAATASFREKPLEFSTRLEYPPSQKKTRPADTMGTAKAMLYAGPFEFRSRALSGLNSAQGKDKERCPSLDRGFPLSMSQSLPFVQKGENKKITPYV